MYAPEHWNLIAVLSPEVTELDGVIRSGEQRLCIRCHQHVTPPAWARAETGARAVALEAARACILGLLVGRVVVALAPPVAVPGEGNTQRQCRLFDEKAEAVGRAGTQPLAQKAFQSACHKHSVHRLPSQDCCTGHCGAFHEHAAVHSLAQVAVGGVHAVGGCCALGDACTRKHSHLLNSKVCHNV